MRKGLKHAGTWAKVTLHEWRDTVRQIETDEGTIREAAQWLREGAAGRALQVLEESMAKRVLSVVRTNKSAGEAPRNSPASPL